MGPWTSVACCPLAIGPAGAACCCPATIIPPVAYDTAIGMPVACDPALGLPEMFASGTISEQPSSAHQQPPQAGLSEK